MDRFAAIRAFVAVVEEGGFAAAARALGLSRSVVNRQVIQLEDTLKTQLLTRNTRKVAATETGLIYFERCKIILADMQAADLAVVSQTGAPRGTLKVNAPMSFGTLHLGPAIADYLIDYPDVDIQLQLDDRFIDPIEEGFDLTVRIAALQDSSLIARRIAPARRVLCASPYFIAKHGTPEHPGDLKTMPCLHYGGLAVGGQWTFEKADEALNVTVRGPLCSNNGEVLIDAALKGLGLTIAPAFMAAPHIKAETLVPLLADWRAPDIAIHALYAPNRHIAPKVRTFIDFLVGRFSRNPDWDSV